MYVVCYSVNVSVCFVCCVSDSVCELFGETIRNIFDVVVILFVKVMGVLSVGGGALLDIPCIVFQLMCVLCFCFVVCGCAVSRRYINVCNNDVFSVVNYMSLDQLTFCVVFNNGRRYVCCNEYYVVSNECDEPTPCLVLPIGAHGGEVLYFGNVFFRCELCFLNCDDICMCVVNKQFELLEFVFNSIYVDLKYNEIIPVLLLDLCVCVVCAVMCSSLVCL